MQISTRIAAITLALATVASQAAAKTEDLGVLTSEGTTFSNSFSTNVASFTDYYTFSIAAPGDVIGSTIDTSFIVMFTRDVTLNSLTLTTATSSTILAKDATADTFMFSGLAAGDYKMAVTGSVWGLGGTGLYAGTIRAETAPVASAAPEATDLAMTLVGLVGVGAMLRRRARH